MAIIYQKTVADKTCILAPREGVLRQFNFGAWTQIRLGFLWSGVSSSDDNNDSGVQEILSIGTAADWVTFGLKNTDTLDLPGFAGCNFIGLTAQGYTDVRWDFGGEQLMYSNTGQLRQSVGRGTSITNSVSATGTTPRCQLDPSPTTNYASAYTLRIDVQNLGLATQTVTMNTSYQILSGSNYGIAGLRSAMNTFANPGTTSSALQWNDGAAAYDLPDGFFLRSPFYNNRMRISAMMAVRYA